MSYIEIKNLNVDFKMKSKLFKQDKLSALSNVNLEIEKNEIFGIVGESGCGKSTLANVILGFIDKYDGEIKIDGLALNKREKNYKELRRKIQIVFQDPFTSFNPRFTVKEILIEPFIVTKSMENANERIVELIKLVGLNENDLNRKIFEFSGGQRQRIAIARAIALNPEILICDEPVSALDVSIQAQICNLLIDLQKKLNLTIIFISHNLALVKKMTNHMAVMYLGCVMEKGETKEIFSNPMHPYTRGLIKSILPIRGNKTELYTMNGEIEAPINADKEECRFLSRCPFKNNCDGKIKNIDASNHFAACMEGSHENNRNDFC